MKRLIPVALTAAIALGCRDDLPTGPSSRLTADAAAQTQAPYSFVDLGSLGAGASALFINEVGQVAGVSGIAPGVTHAFLWDGGQMRDLGTLGGNVSGVSGMNGRGQVVGASTTATGELHAFRWTDGTMDDIGPTATSSQDNQSAYINQSGDVAWTGPTPTGPHAMLWRSGGKVIDLGTLGGSSSQAWGINERGEVVGLSDTGEPGDQHHAFVWAHGVMQDLGTLGGASSWAFGVDDRGQAMGMWSAGNAWPGSVRGFIWDHGQMTDLGLLLPTLRATLPVAMNQRGDVIGQSWQDAYYRNSPQHAFLWSDGALSELPLPPHDPNDFFRMLKPTALNDRGQVVGTYTAIVPTPPAHEANLALVWEGGITSVLPTSSTATGPVPTAINNRGEIAGWWWADHGSHAVLWRRAASE